MTHHRKDDSQGEIVKALEGCGCGWIDCTGDPSIGFDGLLVRHGNVYPVEIKDGSKPPSARELTDNETARWRMLERFDVDVLLLESVADALRFVGAS